MLGIFFKYISFLLAINSFSQDFAIDNLNKKNVDGSDIVYFSNNGGINWQKLNNNFPSDTKLDIGAFTTENDKIAIVSQNRGVFISTKNLENWKNIQVTKEIETAKINTVSFYQNKIFLGTRKKGVFYSENNGSTWQSINNGLKNLTIRKLKVISNKLYACTDEGLYLYDSFLKNWSHVFGEMQINAVSFSDKMIFIGTNKGAFMNIIGQNTWKSIMVDKSLHNISFVNNNLFLMTYNELFTSNNNFQTRQSNQLGIPNDFYTFQVVHHKKAYFAAQWDGIYKKENISDKWIKSDYGIPQKMAIINMIVFGDNIIVSSTNSNRK